MKLDLQKFAEFSARSTIRNTYWIKFELFNTPTVTGQSYNATTNTSDIQYKLTAIKDSGTGVYSFTNQNQVYISINNQVLVNSNINFDFRNVTQIPLANGYLRDILHEQDGTKIINFSVQFNTSSSTLGNMAINNNFTLVNIPRNSIIGEFPVYNDDTTTGVPITINKPMPTFYNTLSVIVNNFIVATRENVENGDILLFTQEELNSIYTKTSNNSNIVLNMVLNTWTDATKTEQIGVSSTTLMSFNLTNANPIFESVSYEDTNLTTLGLTGNNQIIINNYSTVKVTIPLSNKAEAQKGAYITNYLFNDGLSENYSSNSNVIHNIPKYNYSSILTVSAIDSRNNRTEITPSINLINYTQFPQISELSANRKNGVSTTVYLSLKLKLWNDNFGSNRKNEITYFGYRVKASNETWGSQTWYDKTSLFKSKIGSQSIDNIILTEDDEFPIHANGSSDGVPLSPYDIQIRVSDGYSSTIFNTDYEETRVSDGKLLDSYRKTYDGYQYAINGMINSSLNEGLQVYGSLYLNEQPINAMTVIDTTSSTSKTNPLSANQGRLINNKVWYLGSYDTTITSGQSTTISNIRNCIQVIVYYTLNDGYRKSMNIKYGDGNWYMDYLSTNNSVIYFNLNWGNGNLQVSSGATSGTAYIVGYEVYYKDQIL